jgi:GNAT superfamily N-acetyltransferase
MHLVKNERKYWEFIRQLRNDERVKHGFIQSAYITPEQHEKFMEQHSDCFYLCILDEQLAGYVGVINDDIRIATHPDFQKKGVGKFLLSEIKNVFPSACAKIKIDNEASLKLFQSAGFEVKYYLLERK